MEKGEMTGSLEESTTTEQAVRHPDVVLEAESETRSKVYRNKFSQVNYLSI